MAKLTLEIEDLNEKQLKEVMKRITANLNRMDEDSMRLTLIEIVDLFDSLDTEDFFGTEGWRHSFGFED